MCFQTQQEQCYGAMTDTGIKNTISNLNTKKSKIDHVGSIFLNQNH